MELDLFSLAGKSALVTGGSSGIGAMIAEGLLRAGARVVISARKSDELRSTQAELAEFGEVHTISADASTVEGVRSLAAQTAELFPALDILVNNAGATWGQALEDYSESGWDRCLDLNVKSVFFLTQALLPNLRAAARRDDPARIINIGSIDGLKVPQLDTYAYSASKAAVHHLTRTLAKRLGPDSITVNAIAPGPFPSKMMAKTLEAKADVYAEHAPMRRIGQTSDMMGAAIYLASRASSYVTGAVIPVDGGLSTTA